MSAPQRLAIVTGASSGIGAEFARQLSASGQAVLAVARRTDRIEALAEAARKANQAPIHALPLDITREDAARVIHDKAQSLGGASWLVNNAGTAFFGPTVEAEPARQTHQVRLMCESVVALTGAFLKDFIVQKQGIVLNVASTAAFQPTPQMAIYGGCKAFVLSYSEALAMELKGSGVTVTALCPGPVTTEIFDVGAPGVERKRPGHEWSAEDCARFGLAAARKGKVVAIPGVQNAMLATFSQIAPRSWVRAISKRIALSSLGY